jgi:hypothetical protein
MLKLWVALCAPPLLESVAFTVKFTILFGPVGVPAIWPDESMLSPAGKLPVLTVSVSVPAPPDVPTVWEYAVPSVPAGKDVVVMAGGGVSVMVTAAELAGLATEVAVTVAAGSALDASGWATEAPLAVAFATAPAAGAL